MTTQPSPVSSRTEIAAGSCEPGLTQQRPAGVVSENDVSGPPGLLTTHEIAADIRSFIASHVDDDSKLPGAFQELLLLWVRWTDDARAKLAMRIR